MLKYCVIAYIIGEHGKEYITKPDDLKDEQFVYTKEEAEAECKDCVNNTWSPYQFFEIISREIFIPKHFTHLAIFREPYLQWIFEGKKTIEARFSKKKIIPYGVLHIDDTLLLKRSAGLVYGQALVADYKYYNNLDSVLITKIFTQYKKELCLQDDYIKAKLDAKFGSLIFLKEVKRFEKPYKYVKNNRLPWVIIDG
jgi:hypothetical protein